MLVGGSGTAAVESAVASGIAGDGRLLVVDNGVYGARIADIARAHGIDVLRIASPWTVAPDLAAIDDALARDTAIRAVAVVHHETTTGLLNPIEAIADIVHHHERALIVDAVSALAGEHVDLARIRADIVAGTAGKCIGAFPGVAFALVARRTLDRLTRARRPAYYLDLVRLHDGQRAGCGPFTPPLQLLWAFDTALDELAEETIAARIERFATATAEIRAAAERLALERLLADELLSNTLTAFRLPPRRPFRALHDALKRRGFIIYAGQGRLAEEIFRVATIGDVQASDYRRFLDALEEALA